MCEYVMAEKERRCFGKDAKSKWQPARNHRWGEYLTIYQFIKNTDQSFKTILQWLSVWQGQVGGQWEQQQTLNCIYEKFELTSRFTESYYGQA